MAWKIVNGVSTWVPDAGEYQTTDYRNFVNLTPEQQQQFGQSGGTFDNSGLAARANSNTSSGIWQGFKDLFTPQGTAGTSTGGNILDAAGKIGSAGTGIAGAIMANKNFKLQKEAQEYDRSKDRARDENIQQFARNASNGASYVGV